MAGLNLDPNTAANRVPLSEQILLGAALALVTTHLGPGARQAAKDLLISSLRLGRIRWGSQRRMGGYPRPHSSEAQIWSLKYFDDLGLHKYTDVDWDNHCITVTLPDRTGRPFSYRLYLVHLHRGDVLDMLRTAGVAPFEQKSASKPAQPVSAPEMPASSPPPPSAPEAPNKATSATPKTLPDNPEMILSALRLRGFQQEAIARAVVEHKIDLPEDLRAAELRDTVRKLQADKARARGDKPPQHPQWDACDAFVKALRAWRANQL